jgi:hypothetical protein
MGLIHAVDLAGWVMRAAGYNELGAVGRVLGLSGSVVYRAIFSIPRLRLFWNCYVDLHET